MAESISKCFHFGAKVTFNRKKNDLNALELRDFCLIGFDDKKFCLTYWEHRGSMDFTIVEGNIYELLELVPDNPLASIGG